MLNRSASLAMSTSVLEALPGKLDIKRHSPGILYVLLIIAFFFTSIGPVVSEKMFENVDRRTGDGWTMEGQWTLESLVYY